jgi:hypothetical protein
MKNLLLSKCRLLDNREKPDVALWFEIYKMINLNVFLVDRFNLIKTPYRYENKFNIPKLPAVFNKTYEDICLERAQRIMQHSKNINKPITVLWSGGIDSTTVLVSFLRACPNDLDNIYVALNTNSIIENPRFYYDYVRKNFNLLPSENIFDLLNGNSLMVGGEFNDQLFGSDILKEVKDFNGMDLVNAKRTKDNIVPFFLSKGFTKEGANKWYDLLDNHIKNVCPVDINTVHLFFWWYNFCFKWQSVYYRIPSRMTNQALLSDEFLSKYYWQFFESEDFQIWSMLNPDKKINKTWESYKIEAKKFIFDFNKDQDYFDNKIKIGSLHFIFRQRTIPDALAIENGKYHFIEKLDPTEFYMEDNSFTL